MHEFKAIKVLNGFTTKEIKRFKLFLNSPYHNRSKRIKKLFHIISKCYPEFHSQLFSRKNIYKYIFGSRIYNDTTFRVLMHELLELVIRFTALEMFLSNERTVILKTLDKFFMDGNWELISMMIDKILPLLDKQQINSQYFYDSFKVNSFLYNAASVTNTVFNEKYPSRQLELISKAVNNFTVYFFIETIELYLNNIVLKWNYNIPAKVTTEELLLSQLDYSQLLKTMKDESPLSQIFKVHIAAYRAYSNIGQQKYYRNYKALVKKYEQIMSPELKQYHYTILINYCSLKTNKINTVFFTDELLDLYIYFLEKGYYRTSQTDFLQVRLFRDILVISLNNMKYEWAENFAKVYSKKVPKKYRIAMLRYSFAMISAKKGDFKTAISYLKRIDINDDLIKLELHVLSIRSSFECESIDKTFDHIRTFRGFLNRNKLIINERKRLYYEFSNNVETLLLMKEGKINDIVNLKKQIAASQNGININWITKKIFELTKERHQ